MGFDLDDEGEVDRASVIALSRDGMRILVGAPNSDYGGENAGDALAYDLKYYCAQLHI